VTLTITRIPAKNIRNWTSPFGNWGQFRAEIRPLHNWHATESHKHPDGGW